MALYTPPRITASAGALASEWVEESWDVGLHSPLAHRIYGGTRRDYAKKFASGNFGRRSLTRLASAELKSYTSRSSLISLFDTLSGRSYLGDMRTRRHEDILLRLSELLRISLDQIDTDESPWRESEFRVDLYVGPIQGRKRYGERLWWRSMLTQQR